MSCKPSAMLLRMQFCHPRWIGQHSRDAIVDWIVDAAYITGQCPRDDIDFNVVRIFNWCYRLQDVVVLLSPWSLLRDDDFQSQGMMTQWTNQPLQQAWPHDLPPICMDATSAKLRGG